MSQAPTDPETADRQSSGETTTGHRSASGTRTLLLGAVLVVLLLVGVMAAISTLGQDAGTTPDVAFQPDGTRRGPASGSERTPLPDGTLLAFQSDDEIDVHNYVGRPLVVNFWASWCAPCVEEMPDLQQAADELEGRVTVLGINAQDSAEKAREFAADLEITFELARDPSGSYFAAVGGFGWPTTLLVDEGGFIRYRHVGPTDVDQLRGLLETHLGVDAG